MFVNDNNSENHCEIVVCLSFNVGSLIGNNGIIRVTGHFRMILKRKPEKRLLLVRKVSQVPTASVSPAPIVYVVFAVVRLFFV